MTLVENQVKIFASLGTKEQVIFLEKHGNVVIYSGKKEWIEIVYSTEYFFAKQIFNMRTSETKSISIIDKSEVDKIILKKKRNKQSKKHSK